MPDDFIPLAAYLRTPAAPEAPLVDCTAEALPVDETGDLPREPAIDDELARETSAALSAVRCFRAALEDALAVSLDRLLHDIAAGVLARELQIEPANLVRVVERTRERFAGNAPLTVLAHPDEVEVLAAAGFATRADARLRRGDVTILVRSGTIDCSLGARLAAVLDA